MTKLALTLAILLGTAILPAQENKAEPLDTAVLAHFLLEAKLQGYASGDQTRLHKLDDGGLETVYKTGNLSYRDRWYRENQFIGHEVVHYQGKAVWGLNFFGATSDNAEVPPGFPSFHKSALRHVPESAPFRGPAFYQEGEFVYINQVTGSIREFSGVERVFFRGQEIFKLVYHGGLLA